MITKIGKENKKKGRKIKKKEEETSSKCMSVNPSAVAVEGEQLTFECLNYHLR